MMVRKWVADAVGLLLVALVALWLVGAVLGSLLWLVRMLLFALLLVALVVLWWRLRRSRG